MFLNTKYLGIHLSIFIVLPNRHGEYKVLPHSTHLPGSVSTRYFDVQFCHFKPFAFSIKGDVRSSFSLENIKTLPYQ